MRWPRARLVSILLFSLVVLTVRGRPYFAGYYLSPSLLPCYVPVLREIVLILLALYKQNYSIRLAMLMQTSRILTPWELLAVSHR